MMAGSCSFIQPKVSFNEEIKPLINKRCITCHGGVKRNGGFSLLFRKDALDTTESGKPAIIPGDAEHSEMFLRLSHIDPEERMPYKEDPLSKQEIDLIKRWIDEGAEWETHWAYIPPKTDGAPSNKKSFSGFFNFNDFIKNPIDDFTFAVMEANELEPSPEAEKNILLRRVYLDLTGLPPSPSAVKRFIEDDRDNAFELVVDSLLASNAFGERWASWWLDMARYADTKGYEKDASRTIWRYRDWVIKAFNEDMPFDRFTIEQLAGDLLPSPSNDQFIATAFHRNTMNNDEGGTDDEEFRVASLIDRVNTTFQVWQSTTIGCVQCHSHPYDPFRMEEYYKVMAFFNNTRDEDTEGDFPLLREYDSAQTLQVNEIVNWCRSKNQKDGQEVELFLRTLEPKIHPHRCDKFVNGSLMDNKWIGIRHGGSCRIPAVDLTSKSHLLFNYWTGNKGGSFRITIDRPDGPVLTSGRLEPTEGQKAVTVQLDLSKLKDGSMVRDLYWHFYNPSIPADRSVCGVEWFVFQKPLPLSDPSLSVKYLQLVNAKPPSTPVMVENPSEFKRKTFVFERGNRLVHGEEVQPEVPAALNSLPKGVGADRLGFAQWLVDPSNPLTARTMVNRFWEQLFGQGLVTTIEDFGTQGEQPTHPELLDYLAIKFSVDYKWSVKKILKEMVMSGTYRQDSRRKDDRDPSNRWLARGPRVRLTAEQIRDQALEVSGLLSRKMYGKSVMPHQPDRVWQTVYSGESWQTSSGEDSYRRGVYTFIKRTSPYPSVMMFDGSSREVCMVQRVRTNTPLQALVTLNDPVYMEAAVAMTRRVLNEQSPIKRISGLYKMATHKQPSYPTLEVLAKLYEDALLNYQADPEAANRVLSCKSDSAPEAALSVVALAVMNLDEFLTKE